MIALSNLNFTMQRGNRYVATGIPHKLFVGDSRVSLNILSMC